MLEGRSRDYVEHRIRAGVLEQGTVDLLKEAGVGERLEREGHGHGGIELRFDGRGHRIDFPKLTGGRTITVYGQTRGRQGPDRRAARTPAAAAVRGRGRRACTSSTPTSRAIRYRHDGEQHELRCDVIAGCDGFHGVCRPAIPAGALDDARARVPLRLARDPGRGRAVDRGADLRPPRARLRAAQHALAGAQPPLPPVRSRRRPRRLVATSGSGRSCETRLRARRLARSTRGGPIIEKGVTPMRSFVAEPMQYGRLFLAGDAAHIVPPTGAKGLNLARRRRARAGPGAGRVVRPGRGGSTPTRTAACAASGGPSTSPGG